ncbi:MAG TPA: SulP family inorganic anion transporter [Rhizomicrobium sp.]|nr:SulP family inorganic anion transporter [Rhizomicrobium sp.]
MGNGRTKVDADGLNAWAVDAIHAKRLADVLAGVICGVLALLVGLSYAALIFSGPLAPWLSYGITATFLSTAVSALVVALWSSIPFTVAGPGSATTAVTAVLSVSLASRLSAHGGSNLLAPTLIVISLGTAAAGLFLCLLGLTRAGRAVRFIPYPVIGGFLGATGWLIMTGAAQVITGRDPALANIDAFFNPMDIAKLLAGAAVAAALLLGHRRSQSAFVMPTVITAAVGLFYLALGLAHVPVRTAQDHGWLFHLGAAVSFSLPWNSESLAHFPWQTLPPLSGDLLAVIFVTTISTLLSTTGIELATHHEANLNRELNAMGIANLLSAALGGYVGSASVSRTALGYSAGATGRLAGITVAIIAGLMLVVSPGYLGFVPKFALGGLLLFLGIGLVYRWMIESIRQLSVVEYTSLLAIAIVIVVWGFIAGVVFGVVIGCGTFALSASRVNAVKFGFDSARYRSSLDRSADELALLSAHGHELMGFSLQSYLFFGSASGLYQHVKGLLATADFCRFLVFDFRLVTGIDSSAVHSFTQIKRLAAKAGTRLVFVNLSRELEIAFRITGFLADDVVVERDLDHALEKCENVIIEAHRHSDDRHETLVEWLSEVLDDREHGAALAGLCKRIEVAEGDIIARQGDASDAMHFIFDGRVGIIVETGEGNALRVRSLGPRTIIGEIGLLTQRPRSAHIVAETPSVLYALGLDAYDHLKRDNPALIQALLTYVVKVIGERLSFSNQTIGVLQR